MSARTYGLIVAAVLLSNAAGGFAAEPHKSAAPSLVVVARNGSGICEVVGVSNPCNSCEPGPRIHPLRHKSPMAVTLSPEACFGYFPTQWRKWDDACAMPFIPANGFDHNRMNPVIPPASDKQPMKNGMIPSPRPGDPKSRIAPLSPVMPAGYPGTRLN